MDHPRDSDSKTTAACGTSAAASTAHTPAAMAQRASGGGVHTAALPRPNAGISYRRRPNTNRASANTSAVMSSTITTSA